MVPRWGRGGGSVPGVFGGVLPINAPTKPQHSLITAFTGTLIHVDPHQRDPSRPTQTLLNTRALPLQDKLSVCDPTVPCFQKLKKNRGNNNQAFEIAFLLSFWSHYAREVLVMTPNPLASGNQDD